MPQLRLDCTWCLRDWQDCQAAGVISNVAAAVQASQTQHWHCDTRHLYNCAHLAIHWVHVKQLIVHQAYCAKSVVEACTSNVAFTCSFWHTQTCFVSFESYMTVKPLACSPSTSVCRQWFCRWPSQIKELTPHGKLMVWAACVLDVSVCWLSIALIASMLFVGKADDHWLAVWRAWQRNWVVSLAYQGSKHVFRNSNGCFVVTTLLNQFAGGHQHPLKRP